MFKGFTLRKDTIKTILVDSNFEAEMNHTAGDWKSFYEEFMFIYKSRNNNFYIEIIRYLQKFGSDVSLFNLKLWHPQVYEELQKYMVLL